MTRIQKNITLFSSTLFFFFAATLFAYADNDQSISFDKNKSKDTIQIVHALNKEHYRRLDINDSLSNELYNEFIDAIDPHRMYLLKSDVESLHQYDSELDDALMSGNLDSVAAIWNVYSKRHIQQLTLLLDNLRSTTPDHININTDSVIEIDRADSDRPTSLSNSYDLQYRTFLNDYISLKLSENETPDSELLSRLIKRYQSRLEKLKQITADDVYDIFINTYTNLYDPHTNYLSAKSLENFKINMSLSLQGIGAVLQQDGEKTKILRLISGGPAQKSGKIFPGDKIIGVSKSSDIKDIQDVIGWRLDEVVTLIRGEKGSKVNLLIEGNDNKPDRLITIIREEIALEDQAAQKSVTEISLENGEKFKIGVINLPVFYMDFDAYQRGEKDYRSTSRDVAKLIKELKTEDVDGVIIDLRDNGGGSLREAVLLTDLFIDLGPVVQIRDSNNYISRRFRSQTPPLYTGPLLVLTNEYSASASEIFAGAIQDYNRGLIVGNQTFGKGTVQTMADIFEGQLKLTTSKFYRVSGESTQHRGVIPDLKFPSLYQPNEVGESNYKTALPWDTIHPLPHISYFNLDAYLPYLKEHYLNRIANDPDYSYLLEQKQMFDELSERKVQKLNFDARLKEKTAMDDLALFNLNKKRIAKNQLPFKDIYELNQYREDKISQYDPAHRINFEDDFLLMESGRILGDFIDLSQNTPMNNIATVLQ